MKAYKIGLIPGPVYVPEFIREAWLEDYGSADIEEEFFNLYSQNQRLIQKLLNTKNKIVISSGEAMSILWASVKNTLKHDEKLLAVASGLFGEGFAWMAENAGFQSKITAFDYDDIPDPERVRDDIKKYRPKIVTAVHCETPSGTINNYLKEIGRAAHEFGALFVVDFVSSAGGCALDVDDYGIDIGLLGSQKVLSLTSSLSISSISERAWEVIKNVNYHGYEAYQYWRDVPECKYTPYTHDWQSMNALNLSLEKIIAGGIENLFKKHSDAAKLCRDLGRETGLKLFPKNENFSSPTVTAFYVPENWTWENFNLALRKKGLAVGGNYGKLEGHVFRIGHMGSQADKDLVNSGMKIIKEVLNNNG